MTRDTQNIRRLEISEFAARRIAKYLRPMKPKDRQPAGEILAYPVKFPDNHRADVRCCAGASGASYAEMALLDPDGHEIAVTDPRDEFTGIWHVAYAGKDYIVNVMKGKSNE